MTDRGAGFQSGKPELVRLSPFAVHFWARSMFGLLAVHFWSIDHRGLPKNGPKMDSVYKRSTNGPMPGRPSRPPKRCQGPQAGAAGTMSAARSLGFGTHTEAEDPDFISHFYCSQTSGFEQHLQDVVVCHSTAVSLPTSGLVFLMSTLCCTSFCGPFSLCCPFSAVQVHAVHFCMPFCAVYFVLSFLCGPFLCNPLSAVMVCFSRSICMCSRLILKELKDSLSTMSWPASFFTIHSLKTLPNANR